MSDTTRERRTEAFRAKNAARKAARGTAFGTRRAKAARRGLNGKFGRLSKETQALCRGAA